MELNYIQFTKEMKKEYTILLPMMAKIHFSLIRNVFTQYGYKNVLLEDDGPEIAQVGLKYVHNDTCYPALLVIGQFIHALQSGKYDVNKTALMITQTGGGCRASNYIHLLRKALKKAGFENVPVISLNVSGLEKNSGFSLTVPMIRKALAGLVYGDALMLFNNQTKAYEINKGESDALVEQWIQRLSDEMEKGNGYSSSHIKRNLDKMGEEFAQISLNKVKKIKVGIVGEIYVKYSPLGNSHLEEFLLSEGCEPVVPALMDFVLYCIVNNINDTRLYGRTKKQGLIYSLVYKVAYHIQKQIISVYKKDGTFEPPHDFEHLRRCADKVINQGVKMGEGWLIPAEMAALAETGTENIVCAQPFGCLPNHIAGKGAVRAVKALFPEENVVPIDYDPSATRVNQENRIKLMLATARENLKEHS